MIELSKFERDRSTVATTSRDRALGTALAELALTVCLIVAIAVIFAVAGTSGALAQRSDLIMMEESSGTPWHHFSHRRGHGRSDRSRLARRSAGALKARPAPRQDNDRLPPPLIPEPSSNWHVAVEALGSAA
jgi:hypothetical protein